LSLDKETQTHTKLELTEFNLLLQLIKFPNNPNHPFSIQATINSTKTVNTQVNTLIHEIAHELLHKDDKFTKQEKEIQAEAVAYVVCNHLGLEAKSFNYLALYGADSKKIIDNLEVVSGCVKEILGKSLLKTKYS
jgi:hypothetical protein